MKEGDRVKFIGFNARPWETVGTVSDAQSSFIGVKWDARPNPTGWLHPSQVKVIESEN